MAHITQRIDTGHTEVVHDAQFDFYGKRLATCSSDKVIKVYDVVGDEHALSAELKVHEGPVWQVSWAHPQFGSLLASCGFDRRVIVQAEHAPGQWTPLLSFEQHSSSVNGIAWAPSSFGLKLACASSDGRVSIVSHGEGDVWSVAMLDDCSQGVNAVSWAPPSVGRMVATAGCDGAIRIHSATVSEDGSERWHVSAVLSGRHKEWVRDVAWCPQAFGHTHASGQAALASCSDDGLVILWKLNGGKWDAAPLPPFPAPCWRVSWNTSGRVLAVTSGDSTVTLWKETLHGTWQQLTTVPDPTLPMVQQSMPQLGKVHY